MADIFVSYNSSDREWAYWIGRELAAQGHDPHIHEWELQPGEDIYDWMERRHEAADHVLCVISDDYLRAPYSRLERNAALWQAASERPGFVLFVVVKHCKLPTLADHFRRCELFNISEDEARNRFRDFMAKREAVLEAVFPGQVAVSNIPIRVPAHFLGREDSLEAVRAALSRYEGRVAITALHGLRGVGKTTLAAAYAERHAGDYRATWWIRAENEATMRTDVVGLGVRLKWIDADAKEEGALAAVLERLRQEGDGLLLIYDNAVDAKALKPYLPTGGRAHVLLTSNAHAWRGLASPVEIRLWPRQIGAAYLVARTGRHSEMEAAEALSETLGGLPLAHEQAAAYCERLDVSLADYARRFAASPAKFLDDQPDAPAEYHDGLTVAKTFALAIEEAARMNAAAEPLIVHAALMAAEAIPLFLFAEGRASLGEPLAAALEDDGLDEVVATLRAFALVDREQIPDERDPALTTDSIRLHRLVRQVASMRRDAGGRDLIRDRLSHAVAELYPARALVDPAFWPRARRLDAIALDLAEDATPTPATVSLTSYLAGYRQSALGAFGEADRYYRKALAGSETVFGAESVETAGLLHNHAYLHEFSGDTPLARSIYERALALREKVLGEDEERTTNTRNNLARMMGDLGELDGARSLLERSLATRRRQLGSDDLTTINSIHDLAYVLFRQKDYAAAQVLFDEALATCRRVHGENHFATSYLLNSYGHLQHALGNSDSAGECYRRALAIDAEVYGAEHTTTLNAHAVLARHMLRVGNFAGAVGEAEMALAGLDARFGPEHQRTRNAAGIVAAALDGTGRAAEAEAMRTKYGVQNFSE
ncbi:MAG: tetratricopeptide repeat protein [Rhizobiaceae bacterium]